ncbi:MAG: ion transporter [Bosea sp. (in: a-proteobacteria)]
MLAKLVEHPLTEKIVIALIVINAITLGLETSPSVMASYGPFLMALDKAILAVFVVELVARMVVKRGAFFRDPWSLFDLFVVGIALVPSSEGLSVLRALRILRALRLVTMVPSLRKVVAGLVGALPGMGSIGLLLVLVYYVFAVMGTKLFAATNPELFGSVGTTAYTLFQAMTFDDWSNGIVKPLIEKGHEWGWIFVMIFMVLSAFMVLNLFIGVVVTALDEVTASEAPKITHPAHSDEKVIAELAALRTEIVALSRAVAAKG